MLMTGMSLPLASMTMAETTYTSYNDAWESHADGDTYYLTADEDDQEAKSLLTDTFTIDGSDGNDGRYTLTWKEGEENKYGNAMDVGVGGVLTVSNVIFADYKDYFLQVDGGKVVSITNVDFINVDGAASQAGDNGPAICLVENSTYGSTIGTISGCTFDGIMTYSTGYIGGAIYLGGSNTSIVTIENSTFNGNMAGHGGAIYVASGGNIDSITNCVFTNNVAYKSTYGDGGAIYYAASDAGTHELEVANSVFENNSAVSQGGAIHVTNNGQGWYSTGTDLTVKNSEFTGNTALGGGAIYTNSYCSLVVENSTFTGNSSTSSNTAYHGGAIYIGTNNTASISDSLFVSNSANYYGGAIYMSSALSLTDTSFYGNSAVTGGAIYNNSKSLTITAEHDDVVFAGNSATGYGDAIYNTSSLNSNVYLYANEDQTISFYDSIYNASDSPSLYFGSASYTGTVEVYDEITNGKLYLYGGELILGASVEQTMEGVTVEASRALLSSLTLTIAGGTTLTAIADCLGADNTITNSGTINLQTGTLSQSISGTGGINIDNQQITFADGVGFASNSWHVSGTSNTMSTSTTNTVSFDKGIAGDGITASRLELVDGNYSFTSNISDIEIVLGLGDVILNGSDVAITNVKWSNLSITEVSATETVTLLTGESIGQSFTDMSSFTVDVSFLSEGDFDGLRIFSVTIDDADMLAAYEEAYVYGNTFAFELDGFENTDIDIAIFDTEDFELWVNGTQIVNYEFAVMSDGVSLALVTTIPEPTTATLSLAALVGLLMRRRRSSL